MKRTLIIIMLALSFMQLAFMAGFARGEMSIEVKSGIADSADNKVYIIYNIGAKEEMSTRTTVIMPEQGIRSNSKNIELAKGDTAFGIVCLDNGLKPGQYLVRVVVSNDDFRRVKHRIIEVI